MTRNFFPYALLVKHYSSYVSRIRTKLLCPSCPTYRVIETREVGHLIPCPCANPIILESNDGIRDVYFLRELEPTTHPITESHPTRSSNAKNGVKGRPKGRERGTVEKMLQIYRFLETKSEPVYRAAIEKVVGFNRT